MRLFGWFRIANRQACAMADVQNVNPIGSDGEKDAVFVVSAAVENFTDFCFDKFRFQSQRAAFRKGIQRINDFNQLIVPANSGFWVLTGQPLISLINITFGRRQNDDLMGIHRGERGIL